MPLHLNRTMHQSLETCLSVWADPCTRPLEICFSTWTETMHQQFRRWSATKDKRFLGKTGKGGSLAGSENRRRQARITARFTEAEAQAIKSMADRAGVSVASYLRCRALDQPTSRATRRPTLNHQLSAQILAQLIITNKRICDSAGTGKDRPELDAAYRDLSEMRGLLFEAMGRSP